MDVKLENLIEKIKKEAVEEGRRNSEEIIRKAEQEASSIVDNAGKEAEKIIEEARSKAADFKSNSESALGQAARDVELLLKEKIMDLFDRVLKREVTASLAPEFLKELILKIVSGWTEDKKGEVTLSARDKERLEQLLISGTRKSLKDTITLRVAGNVSGGFLIGLKGDDVYYDFTDQSVAESLKAFLNPSLKEILEGKDG